ncbi:T9SS type B sorting domain-containing protein [Flavobacterium phragmitis]|uniref:Gliding motility-associated C-terminal domain-containing protein n=1 Tax=Flavobacterium phragmitis TaxID=739143 RepID=A0A1I1JZT7_9FLAO|nr:T9SS type B sorting domain-containing protein [Flavobacterium phragmitis]SFC53771.1 gliding motility-associated C-terminal domain-containing protein [Flavobacterium phragmitis]
MKKPTTLKSVLVVLFFIQTFIVFAQKDFTPRYDKSLKGDMLLIGNNILNRDVRNNERPNNNYTGLQDNNNFNMGYINVDPGGGRFSSSSATLTIPAASKECYKIAYAGLYWTGIYSIKDVNDRVVDRTKLGSVEFKLANTNTYEKIQGEKIYDYYENTPNTANGSQVIYAYYSNVTNLIQGLANPEGSYTLANVIATNGNIDGGFAAGWSLFVVYEDPKLSAKYITSFDGFRFIKANSPDVNYEISGFKTIPNGEVKVKLAFAAIEGDNNTTGDSYSLNGTDLFTNERPVNNFFNSTINNVDGAFNGVNDRRPNSSNTLGYDSGIIKLGNTVNNVIIKNNDTKATLKLKTRGDGYGLFFNAFNVEIIEPKIVLTKIVENDKGTNIGGQNVTLGQHLNYIIGFRNTGNDDATDFTIRDQLPINVIFNYPGDMVLPAGVRVKSWTPATRNIVFEVTDANLLKAGRLTETKIELKVQVIPDCTMLDEACSDSIDNSAYATYKGTQNTTFTISDDPSVNTNTGCILVPKATNFLVGVAGCRYNRNVTLCTASVNLVAADGYSTYTWYSDEARTREIGRGQTFVAKEPGTYYVYNLAPAPCRSIYEAFTVTRFGTTVNNPVNDFADEIVTCPNDGKQLPKIFLCGANASKLIKTGITDSSNIVWERLDTASCPAVSNDRCANENESCTWQPVASGPDYNVKDAGQYRLTINYAGGCFSRFYFNVFTNPLNPREEHVDILCGQSGSIKILDVPTGYQYAIKTDPNGTIQNWEWQTSNTFPIYNEGSYTVFIKQQGVTSIPCIFKIENIQIRRRNMSLVNEQTQPVCVGDTGSIKIGVENYNAQYYIYLYNGNTIERSAGPVSDLEYTFASLSYGTNGINYRVRVTSSPVGSGNPQPSCDQSVYFRINPPNNQLRVTATLREPLTACSPGQIFLSASNGRAPYHYFVNGASSYISENPFAVTEGGQYNIVVIDDAGCKAETSINVPVVSKPTYTVNATSSLCYDGTSSIKIENIVPNGNTMAYSINDGATYQTNPNFLNLEPGTYKVKVRYSITYTTSNGSRDTKHCYSDTENVIITGPTSALTASAGVAALAGCTDPDGDGIKDGGIIRFNNVEGGKAPYQFSFDNGAHFGTAREIAARPGTYQLVVKDDNGCTFTIPYEVKLDPIPANPIINTVDTVYGCDGLATSTVKVTTPETSGDTAYTYEYYLDDVPNVPITNNVFTGVKSGSYTVKVKYKATQVPTYSNLLIEDFGRGSYTTTPGINPGYCFEDETSTHLAPDYKCNRDEWINDGEYAVASSIRTRFDNSWIVAKDHTVPQHPLGRFLCVNVGGTAGIGGILYSKPISDVIPNQPVIISLWAENLIVKTSTSHADPKLTIQLINNLNGVGGPETIVATTDTNNPWVVPKTEQWEYRELSLDPKAFNNLSFVIRSYSNEFNGNDVLIDDIWVRQIPESCGGETEFPVVIESGKGFEVSDPEINNVTCTGGNTGSIVYEVKNFTSGYEYKINNGSWTPSTAATLELNNLAVGNYKIIIRSDATGVCSESFDIDITAPNPVTSLATVTKQPTCIDGAVITATAGGGKPGYQYELRQGSNIIIAYQANNVFTKLADGSNIPVGTYRVYVRDSGGCESAASDPITVIAPVPPKAVLASNSDLCYDTKDRATLVVTASDGKLPYSYSLNGGNGQNNNTFTNVGPGTHTIVVTDGNGCTVEIKDIIIARELFVRAEVTKPLDCTNSPDAQITITATDGTPGYTYEVSTNGGTSFASIGSNVYPAAAAGSYIFRVTDSKGCTALTPAVTVSTKLAPTATAKGTDPKCHNGSDGSITVTPEGGNGATYTYSFNGSATFGTSATLSNLSAGDYTYQVRDGKGCLSPVYNISLANPTEVVASASFTPNTTCSTSTVITVSAVGGTGTYSYSFGAGNTTYNGTRTITVTNTSSEQTITFNVRDSNGCTDTETIKVPAYNPPTGLSFSTPAGITCNATTTSLTVTAVGGVAPFTYAVTSGPNSPTQTTSGTFTGLVPGTYTFRVTDANGCVASDSKTIDAAPSISVSGDFTNELCYSAHNGTATFEIIGASSAGAYTYTFSPTAGTLTKNNNTITVTGLATGTYTLVVRDNATGCTSNTASVTIKAATQIDFTVNASKITCNNKISTLSITGITGGAPGYTYAYAASGSTAPTTPYGTVLTVDTASLTTTVDVYVKDINGCVVKKTVSIATEDAPQIDTPATQCYTGSPVSVTITGTYQGPATFSKDGTTFVSSPTFSLTPETYNLTLKDKFGCEASVVYIVPQQLTITPTIVANTTCTPNVTISLSSTGGTGTRAYAVSFNGGAYSAVTSPYTATAAGTYKFRVNDTANPVCYAYTADIPVTLNATTFAISTSKTDVKCNGAATGTISVSTTAGKSPYTYNVTRGGTSVSTTALTTGLIAGVYDITVTDGIGCTGTAQVTITQPDLLEADATVDPFTCSTTNAKESKDVTVTVTGGVLPYTYSFNGGSYETGNTFEVSDNGSPQSVTYSVKDGNGCTTTVKTINISPLNPPKISSVSATVIYCDPVASRTSTAKINATAGTGTLVYTIVSGPTINTTGVANGEFTGLTSGSYVFRVTDASGCYAEFSKNIPAVVAITVRPTKLNDVYCKGGSTGNVRFNVTNFTSTYSYTVNSEATVSGRNQTVFTLANRPAGIYNVVFVDETTNCTTTEQVEILEPTDALDLVIDSNVNSNCKKLTSTVTVHATGGTGTYEYAILDADNTAATPIYGPNPVFEINSNSGADLNWVIYAKDANGCITSENVTIAGDTQPTVTLDVVNQCTASGSSFIIEATGANGVLPYTYTINTGVAPSPANRFTVGAGTYVVTITDGNGCTNTETVTVNDAMIATAVRVKDLTCAAISPTDASIEVKVTGGNPSFGYRVRVLPAAYTGTPIPFTSTRSFVYTTATDGTYEFEITDANGCIKATNTIVINPTPVVTADYTPTNPTCNAGTDGVVQLNALTGEAPFKYNFNGSGFGDKYIFGGLTAGTYNYIVRDAKGCEYASTAVLTEPAPIDGLVEGTPIICDLNTLGTFKVSVVSGGVAPFVYTLYDTNRNQLQTYTETSVSPTAVHTFSGLNFGYYYVTIVDANGCKFETSRLRIETPPYLQITTTIDSNSCATGVDVTVTTTGGEGPYRYSIFGQAETAPLASNSYTFIGLAHNRTYYLQVKDKNNCISIAEVITPPAPSNIKITATSQTDATCAGSANGILNFTVEDYDSTVTTIHYRILDELTQLPLTTPIEDDLTGAAGGPVSETINNLPAGNYILEVTEVGGTVCSTAYTFRIDQPAQPLNSIITSVVPANCRSGAIVTMRTTGGTAPYYYGVALSPAMPTVFTSTNNVIELDPSSGTDWNIVVRDSKGCEVLRSQIIPVDSSPEIALQIVDRCVAEGNFSVNVIETNPGTGAYSISVDSDNAYSPLTGGLPYVVTNLTSGSHRIYIKDANGCVDFEDININAPLDLQPAVVTADPTCTDVNAGSITLSTTGGTGTYTYTIDAAGAVVTNNVISNLPFGNYTVTVTDGFCNATVPVELKAPIPVTFDADVIDAACYNSATGSITVNLLPGNTETPYTYAIASATATPLPGGIVLVGNKFTNVPQGSYEITVTSGKGCPATHIYDVHQPAAALDAIATVDPYSCNASNKVQQAVVRIIPSGGTTDYKYNFDGGTEYYDDNTTLVTDDGTVQRIYYYVIDSKGCTFSNYVDVNPYQELTTIDFAIATAPVCPTNVADIRVDVTGGYTPYAKYEIISPIYRDNLNSDTFTGLTPNVNYLFRVTDANGCYIEGNYTVEPVVPINIVRTSSTNVSCNTLNGTSNNGTATFTVSDFSTTGNYTVSVSYNPATLPVVTPSIVNDVITLNGLVEGTYTVTVEDNTTHCSKSAAVVITMPAPIVFTATGSNVYCTEDNSTITISNITGGTSAYSYAAVRAGQPAPTTFAPATDLLVVDTDLTNLSWDVYVQDSNLCISEPVRVDITHDAAPVLNMPAQQCFRGANLTVDLDVLSTTFNGVKSFTIDGLATSSTATFTGPGQYKIVLTDENGCTDEQDYIIEEQLIVGASIQQDLYCNPSTALIDVTIKGGVGTYTYQMYRNGVPEGLPGTATGDFTETVTQIGDYYFVITDSNVPCTAQTDPVTVTTPTNPTGLEAHIDVTCETLSDGSLTITPSDGVGPYTFVLTGVANTTGDTTGIYTGLAAGSYSVVITDSKGCTSAPVNVTIDEPVELTAPHAITPNAGCYTTTEIVVSPVGGTQPYYYNFNGKGYVEGANKISVANDGSIANVTYTVKDANGCETPVVTVPIVPLNKPSDLDFTPTAITCVTGNSSDVTVRATNGVGQLTFEIIEFNGAAPAVAYTPQVVADNTIAAVFNDLPFGDYLFRVTDSNTCSYDELLTIKDVIRINADGQSIADMSCNTTNDGKVTFTVSGFAGTYTYSITKDGAPFTGPTVTSDASIELTNLAFGVYEITAVDNITGCDIKASAEVKQPTIVEVDLIENLDANCNRGAIVEVLGKGGNPGYTYSFVDASIPGPGTFDPETRRELDPTITAWHIYARDINGCTSLPLLVNIGTSPLPTGFTAAATSQCPDGDGNYEIVVTPGSGMAPFTYSIGGGFQSELTFTVNVPKAYDLVVRDRFGCTTTFPVALTILQPVVLDVVKDIQPTCADGDGQVTATATGGTGNFSYTLDGVTTLTTTPAIFTGIAHGSHTIVVTDLGTPSNCTDTVTFELEKATEVTGFKAVATPVTCNGGSDGTIIASMDPTNPGVNDNPKYMYSINGGTPQESPVFTGLTQGTYTVSVVSGRNCPASATVVVTEPALIVVPNPAVVQYGCAAGNNSNAATITVTGVTGGNEKYPNYEFIRNGVVMYKGERNVFTERDLLGGNYVVNVYDENNCMGSVVVTVPVNPYINLDKVVIRVTDEITCTNNEDILVEVTTTPGVNPVLDFVITDAAGNAVAGNPNNQTGIFTDLPIGNYLVTVTNPATGCSIVTPHYVNSANSFEIKAVTTNREICYGTTNGSVELTFIDNQPTPTNEAGIFDYIITGSNGYSLATTRSANAGPVVISNLAAGVYDVTATLVGKPYCTVTTMFTISQPFNELVVTTTKDDITCVTDNNDGVIYATATGGWDNEYEYQLVKGSTIVVDYSEQFTFSGLTEGVYTVNVKDSKGCIASSTETLVIPAPITATATVNLTMLACYGDKTGVITVNPPTGGQGSNYLYTLNYLSENPVISSGPVVSPVFSGLAAGRYSVTVTDGFTCQGTTNEILIEEPTLVTPMLKQSRAQTCQTLTELTLTVEGGTPPYTYSADGTNYSAPFASTVSFEVPVGSYKYFVRDANGCNSFVSNSVEIDPLEPLRLEVNKESAVVKCTGQATGAIIVEAFGGLGSYTYTLTGSETRPAQDNGIFENLAIGTYRITVNSVDCAITSEEIVITEPSRALQAEFFPTDVTCFGQNNGRLEIVASGGTGIIKYAVSPNMSQFDTKVVYDKLAPGDYQAIAQDENGCYVLYDFTIHEPRPVIVTEVPNSMIPEVCDGDKDGAFSIEVRGGTAPYSVSLDVPTGPFTEGALTQTVFDFTNLSGGAHTVYVKDAKGCPVDFEVNMPEPVILNPIAEVTYDCVNNAQANRVVVTVDASNNPTDVDYSLDNNGTYQPSNIFIDVPAGDHFIVARHTNGCEVPTAIFKVDPVAPLSLIDITNQSNEINTISVKASGGFAPYEYSFNGEPFSSSNTYRIYKTDVYKVIVRDKNGCEATIDVPGTFYDFCLPNYFTPNGTGTNTTIGPDCGALAYKDLTFDVYDRYGRVVGKYRVGGKWDGRYNGDELPTGDYWYVLKLNDPKDNREFVGHFTLYR